MSVGLPPSGSVGADFTSLLPPVFACYQWDVDTVTVEPRIVTEKFKDVGGRSAGWSDSDPLLVVTGTLRIAAGCQPLWQGDWLQAKDVSVSEDTAYRDAVADDRMWFRVESASAANVGRNRPALQSVVLHYDPHLHALIIADPAVIEVVDVDVAPS